MGPFQCGWLLLCRQFRYHVSRLECSAPCHADHIPAQAIWAIVTRGLTVAASRLDENMGHVTRHGAS